MMETCKGCLCLDIDGTLTADPYKIPSEVVEFLSELYLRGWRFIFVTGRTYSFAMKAMKAFEFPYYFALQNGADILSMPGKKKVAQSYLPAQFISYFEMLYRKWEEDFIIYSGYEKGDFCYYRPKRFSKKMLEHLEIIQALSDEPWEERDEFIFSDNEAFPLVKCFGTESQMQEVHELLQSVPEVHSTYIHDPLSKDGIYLTLITSHEASKGSVIRRMRPYFQEGTIFVAAGDDRNDISMLMEADMAIVMKTAPKEMFSLADKIAEPAKDLGIIEAICCLTGEKYGQ